MITLLKAFRFSFVIHFLSFWAYFTWDLYEQNQMYQEIFQIMQKELTENSGSGFSIAYESTNSYETLFWYGCVTFPLLMAAYVFYKKKFLTK
ncbi:hypothetical protein C7R92_18385 [Brevibacillus porteri]|uniref:DUF4306 domain-containing protein n=1 Tax=Brevibacillus porteri TaxID=2126350 RepID=A0ABX5FM63_9BACL|nr:hypothetical protein C7R92_18385 [Brevibacillus porteri]